MKSRKPKKDDQEKCQEAYEILLDFLKNNPREGAVWVGVMMSAIADSFFDSGVSYEEYKKEMERATCLYKYVWEE